MSPLSFVGLFLLDSGADLAEKRAPSPESETGPCDGVPGTPTGASGERPVTRDRDPRGHREQLHVLNLVE